MKNLIRKILKEEVKQKSLTVVFGGISYATPTWMEEQWVNAGLPTDNVKFLKHTSNTLSTLKKQFLEWKLLLNQVSPL